MREGTGVDIRLESVRIVSGEGNTFGVEEVRDVFKEFQKLNVVIVEVGLGSVDREEFPMGLFLPLRRFGKFGLDGEGDVEALGSSLNKGGSKIAS